MNPLEAVADAIMLREGWLPGSRSNRNRNPGNLRAGSGQIGNDTDGYAIFPSFVAGYTALLTDLAAKFTGYSKTGLGPASTLLQLFEVYAPAADHNDPLRYAEYVAQWLTKALRKSIDVKTPLSAIWQTTPAAVGKGS